MVGGGHGNALVCDGAMVPAPAPPVCQALRGGVQGSAFPQTPSAWRGSVGIHPCWRPSWYDQAGASTTPVTDELPIFHVQKNQFCTTGKSDTVTMDGRSTDLESIHAGK